jgi:integrase
MLTLLFHWKAFYNGLLTRCLPGDIAVQQKLTPAFIAKAPAPEKGRTFYWEGGGFGLQVMASGARSYVVQYRANGVSRRMSLPIELSLLDARREAKKIIGTVARGGDPLAEKRRAKAAKQKTAQADKNTLACRTEEYFVKELPKLRNARKRELILRKLVLPVLGDKSIRDIDRDDIIELLDDIEDKHGPHQAQSAYAFTSRVLNWYAIKDKTYRSPLVRGMARTKPKEHIRKRIVTDDELCRVWRAAETFQRPYGDWIRFCLLTATRRAESAEMPWSELQGADWLIPAERMKGKMPHLVPLSGKAQEILAKMPRIGEYVFTVKGRSPYTSRTTPKAQLDAASGVTGWVHHDLRRTARSLMSRAGVPIAIAEKCIAHLPGVVEQTYDAYDYAKEKREAFEALANIIDRILSPAENILPFKKAE